jgi:hypothetical protein
MDAYSDEEIARLISCPKKVSVPPAKNLRLNGADWRNDAKLAPTDGTKGIFSMFMRRNEDFPEDFSIGLVYRPEDGTSDITLLRCNGKHGFFNGGAGADPDHPHFHFHVHKASAKAIRAGFTPEKFADKTTEFASYEQAVQHYIKVVQLNPRDASRYFPSESQSEIEFTE